MIHLSLLLEVISEGKLLRREAIELVEQNIHLLNVSRKKGKDVLRVCVKSMTEYTMKKVGHRSICWCFSEIEEERNNKKRTSTDFFFYSRKRKIISRGIGVLSDSFESEVM